MIRQILQHLGDSQEGTLFSFSLKHDCGFCPSGCRLGSLGVPTGRVYRSSRRSFTMQCTECGMQWMLTVHRVAQAMARKADTEKHWGRPIIARLWAEWASSVDDQRGRRKVKGKQR